MTLVNLIRSPTRAILFSDLHYSHKTKDTCFKVLRFIHDLAIQKSAVVYFLGDFWDHVYRRGTLPVDLLNEIVRFFKTEWVVSLIMIPGNHDHFDAEGKEHGLEMFKNIGRITVYDVPTFDKDKVFIPYTNDNKLIQELMLEAVEKGAKMVFTHLDVMGAQMNNTKVSTKGCSKDIFTIPTYSGHYHKPSKHGNVTYIGSPYQIHLGEAGDNKTLKIIDYTTGKLIEEIPICIGIRHYKVGTMDEIPEDIKPNDRLVLSSDFLEDTKIDELRKNGVVVTIKQPVVKKESTRIKITPNDDPSEAWNEYIKTEGNQCRRQESNRAWEWFKTLTEVKDTWNKRASLQTITGERTNVLFEEMTISNFGPFSGTHKVDFNTGVHLVTGRYLNSTEADSNGVGKSLYTAGAFLWACTGKTDPRFGSKNSSSKWNQLTYDVISTGKTSAYVILNGKVNGKEFSLSRCMSCEHNKKSHELTFVVDGIGHNCNTISMTQKRIYLNLFGSTEQDFNLYDFLTRTVVWSQRSVPGFLDLHDKTSRDELRKLVNIQFWWDIEDTFRRIHSDVKKNKNQLAAWIDESKEQIQSLKSNIESSKVIRDKEFNNELTNIKTSEMELKRVQDELDKLPDFSNDSYLTEYTECKRKYDECEKLMDTLEHIVSNVDECFCPPKEIEEERCRREASNALIQSTIDSMKKGTCDVCHSTVTDDQYNARIKELKKQIKPLYDVDIEEMKLEYLKSVEDQRIKSMEEHTHLVNELKAKEETKKQYTKWLKLKEEKVRLKMYLDGIEDKNSPKVVHDFVIESDQKRLEEKQRGLIQLYEKYDNTVKEYKKCDSLEPHLHKHGITSYILDNVSNRLEFMVNELLGANYFEIERSSTDRIVKKFKGSNMSLMSGGEHQKLKIATFLAYRKLIQEQCNWKCNLVIFDEPDTYVDASGLKAMMNMIKTESKDMCTMVISHSNTMHRDMDLFDNHIEIERDHNGSRKRKRI